MARTRTRQTLDEKIEAQKQAVDRIKEKYEVAVAELEQLMTKRDQLRQKELLDAIAASERSYEEIMEFLGGSGSEEAAD